MLARPDGTLHGELSSKVHPAHFEAFVFALGATVRGREGRVIKVDDLGKAPLRLGISICNDNYHAGLLRTLYAATPQLVLQPHCAPVPGATLGFPQAASDLMAVRLAGAATAMARIMETPAAFTNYYGPWPSGDAGRLPFLWRPMTGIMMRNAMFRGGASITARGGDGGSMPRRRGQAG